MEEEINQNNEHWMEKPERGSFWVVSFSLWIYNLLGKTLSRLILYPVIGYFFLTDHKGRKTSQEYLDRIYQDPRGKKTLGKAPGHWESFQRYYEFGLAYLDRLSLWQGKYKGYHFDLEEIDRHLMPLVNREEGFILLSAHLGSPEIMRGALHHLNKSVRLSVLMHLQNAQGFNQVLEDLNQELTTKIIHLESITPQTVLNLQDSLGQGELVAVMGDRVTLNSQGRTTTVPFLGKKASFPQGPITLAALLKYPVFLFFGMRSGKNTYKVIVRPFSPKIKLPRKQRQEKLAELIEQYSKELEDICCEYPFQWFNFYDFWDSK